MPRATFLSISFASRFFAALFSRRNAKIEMHITNKRKAASLKRSQFARSCRRSSSLVLVIDTAGINTRVCFESVYLHLRHVPVFASSSCVQLAETLPGDPSLSLSLSKQTSPGNVTAIGTPYVSPDPTSALNRPACVRGSCVARS